MNRVVQLQLLETRRLMAAGDFDPTFNGTGWNHVLTGGSPGAAVAVDVDDNVLVVGQDIGTEHLAVTRFLQNGLLDTDFGAGGVFTTSIDDKDFAQDVVVVGSSIYVAGTFEDTGMGGNTGVFVLRLTSAGTLDPTFDGDGVAIADLPGTLQTGMEMLIDGGSIYVAGADNGNALVVKMNATTGVLDALWGVGGFATNGIGGPATITGIGVQSDNKIVIAGGDGTGGVLARLDLDGDLDTSYGTALTGVVTPTVDQFSTIDHIAIGALDVVYAVGTSANNIPKNIATLRKFDSDGAIYNLVNYPANAFDGDGEAVVDLQPSATHVFGTGVSLDASGRAVISGFISDLATFSSAFASRFNPNTGALDTSFGTDPSHNFGMNGIASTDADGFAAAAEVTKDSDGNVVIGGSSSEGLLAARFEGGGVVVVPPVADAGDDQTVNEGQLVNFDGSGSTGTGLSYAWDLDDDGDFDDAFTAMASWTYTDNDIVTVSLKVTDTSLQESIDTTIITINNVNPVLDTVVISSPINENGSANLSGTYHDDGSADTHTIDIDWDGNGTYEVLGVSVSGGSFNFNHQYLDDNPTNTSSDTFNVGVRLHDDDAGLDTGSASLTVNNVAPTVNPIAGPASPLVRQQTASFSGSFNDVGTLDTHDVSWDFGDSNVIAYHSSTDIGALTPTHTYTSSGTFTVTLSVKDDDGGIGTQTVVVNVVAAAIQGGNLVVGGTNAADVINVSTTATPGQLKVLFNGVEFGRFTPSGHVIVDAGAGADRVTIGNNVGATEVFGGAGNDTLIGGNGSDTLDGGSEDDSLDGNAGTDSLLGGTGNDTILGGTENDISRGGDGNDSISNSGGDDLLDGGIGNDTLVCGAGADEAHGGAGNDSITGGAGNDSLFGDADNDTIDGGGDSDFIDGGSGSDDLNGGAGTDIVLGGLDNDIVQGGAERDLLIGGDGADSILGNADEDILVAGMTTNDGNEANLKSILATWDGAGTYATRRNALLAGLLQPSNLIDDGDVDTLTGGSGTDWFILDTAQDVNDQHAGETETDD